MAFSKYIIHIFSCHVTVKCCVKSGDAILTVCPPFQAQTVSRIYKSQLSWCQAPQRGRTSIRRLPPSVAAAAKSPVQLPSWTYIPSSTQCELWKFGGGIGGLGSQMLPNIFLIHEQNQNGTAEQLLHSCTLTAISNSPPSWERLLFRLVF